jgi:hypothetical protein
MTPFSIQVPKGDDVVLETWDEGHTCGLDLLSILADECHGFAPMDSDQRSIAKLHGPQHRAIEL